jgi:hypothetical protein
VYGEDFLADMRSTNVFLNTISCYLKVLPLYDVARFITSQFNLNTLNNSIEKLLYTRVISL